MFSTLPKTIFSFLLTFILSSVLAFIFDKSTILFYGKELTLSLTNLGFYVTSLLKTQWQKEIMLVISNFSFFCDIVFFHPV